MYYITTQFFPTIPYFTDGMVELNCANLIWISHQFEYVRDPSQMRRGPTRTDCQTLSLATGAYAAGGSAAYESQA